MEAVRVWMKKHRIHWLTLVVHGGVLLYYLFRAVQFFVLDPVDEVDWLTLQTGLAGLNLIMLSLACTPLITLTGWSPLVRVRRPLGVYGLVSISFHFIIFVTLFHAFFWEGIFSDILGRNVYRVGFLAFLFMVPLGITSTKGWQKKLRKNWSRLHKLMYLIVILAAMHYIWIDKRPNMLTLLMDGDLAQLGGQLLTNGYIRLELIIVMLLLRVPAIRKPIVSYRNSRKKARSARPAPASSPAA